MTEENIQEAARSEWTTNMKQIKKEVCNLFGITTEELEGRNRRKTYVAARMIFSVRAKDEAKASLREIGRELGDRAAAMVLFYIRRYDNKRRKGAV